MAMNNISKIIIEEVYNFNTREIKCVLRLISQNHQQIFKEYRWSRLCYDNFTC